MKNTSYDIWTLGTGKRSLDEFLSLLPEGTTRVIDIRNYPHSTRMPHFDRKELEKTLSQRGITYSWDRSLSGVSKDPAHQAPGKSGVIDYDAYASGADFKEGLSRLRSAVKATKAAGGKIVVISSESSPFYSPRTMLLGQALEHDTTLTVGHIDAGPDGKPRTRSQEQAVRAILRGDSIADGEYRKLHFQSDRSYSAEPGTLITSRSHDKPDDTKARLIEGQWNYRRAVDIQQDSVAPKSRSRREIYAPSLQKNARWADLTLSFDSSTDTEEARATRHAAGKNYLHISLPAHREDLLEPEFISRSAERIREQIHRRALLAVLANPESDLSAVKLNIAGSDIARIAAKYIEQPVSEEELSGKDRKSLARLRDAGMQLAVSGITQEDIDEYLFQTLSEVMRSPVDITFEDGTTGAIEIGEIRTNGQSGVAQGATLAAQRLGIPASILAPNGWHQIIDDETLMGTDMADEAAFRNRFQLGLHDEVTDEQLRQRAREHTRMRELYEDGLGSGLTELQILALRELGFSNSDIIDMVRIADDNNVVVSSPGELTEFLEQCQGYGISGAEYISAPVAKAALDRAQQKVKDAQEQGVFLVTVKNPLYPASLAALPDESIRVGEYRFEEHDGGASAGRTSTEVFDKRPAVLWMKGDPELLRSPSACVLGSTCPPGESLSAARVVGKGLSDADITTVIALQEGSTEQAARACMDNDGAVLAFTPHGIDYAENAALAEKILSGGGMVISEKGPGEGRATPDERRRASKIAATLGGVAIFVDSLKNGQPMSLLAFAAYAAAGAYRLVYDRLARDRKSDEISSSGDGLERAVKAAKASREQAPSQDTAQLTRTSIQLLRCHGQKDIALVPKDRADLREAVLQKYGNDVIIAPSEQAADYLRARTHGAAISDEGEIDSRETFVGYTGTQSQVAEPWTESLFWVDGQLHTLMAAPDRTPGLPTTYTRETNRALFERFRSEALQLQQEFQKEAGMPEHVPIRFEHALYPVIGENSVKVLLGDEQVACVRYTESGLLRVENSSPLSYDLEEHAHPWTDIFSTKLSAPDPKAVDALALELRGRLMGSDGRLERDLSLGSREEQDEVRKELEEGFRQMDVDNLEVAAQDIAKGLSDGLLHEHEKVERLDPTSVDILIHYRIESIAGIRMMTSDDLQKGYQRRQALLSGMESSLAPLGKDIEALAGGTDNEQAFAYCAARLHAQLSSSQRDMISLEDSLVEIRSLQGDLSEQQKQVLDSLEAIALQAKEMDEVQGGIIRDKADLEDLDRSIERYLQISDKLRAGESILFSETSYDDATALRIGGEDILLFDKATISESQALEVLDKASELAPTPERRKEIQQMHSLLLKGRTLSEAIVTPYGLHLKVGDKEAIFRGLFLDGINDLEKTRAIAADVALRRKKGRTTTTSGLFSEASHESQLGDAQRSIEIARAELSAKEQKRAIQQQKTYQPRAKQEEIKGTLSHGMYIIERDGKQAYADVSLNIRSGFYSKLSRFGENYGWAVDENGRMNLLDASGKEVLDTWIDKIQDNAYDGFVTVEAKGRQNLLDLKKAQFVSPVWYQEIRPYRDGWAICRQDDTLVNYIDKNGNRFFKEGVRSGTEFRDGMITIRYDGETYHYDAKRNILTERQVKQKSLTSSR